MVYNEWSLALEPDFNVPDIQHVLNTTAKPLEIPTAMSIELAAAGIRAAEIEWVTIDPLAGATTTLFKAMPLELENSVVKHLSEILYWPLMSAVASDTQVVSEFFEDPDWCSYLHASKESYFESETASCRRPTISRLSAIRDYLKKWFGSENPTQYSAWQEDFDMGRMLDILSQNDSAGAREMYPFPILPRKTGIMTIMRDLVMNP